MLFTKNILKNFQTSTTGIVDVMSIEMVFSIRKNDSYFLRKFSSPTFYEGGEEVTPDSCKEARHRFYSKRMLRISGSIVKIEENARNEDLMNKNTNFSREQKH